jgi:hypothetical protein
VITGGGLLFVFARSFESARALLDPLAKDGSLEMFSQTFYDAARFPTLTAGALLLMLAVAAAGWRRKSLTLVQFALSLPVRAAARLRSDSRAFTRDLAQFAPGRAEMLLVGALVLLALAAQGIFLMRPFWHDEAYTVAVFANAPLREALTDYHLPNNHLFHTLLVHMMYSIFGYQQWAVRLPAFAAGLLAVPALYFLARRLYGIWSAAAASAMAAALPALVDLNTSARGYSLVILFALLLLILGLYVRQRANLLAWSLIVSIAVLGFYTVPIFSFAYASLAAWLGLMLLTGAVSQAAYGARWRILLWLAGATATAAALTLLLYLPVFLRSGLQSVFPREVISPHGFADFLGGLQFRLVESADLLTTGLPSAAGWLLAVGFGLSLLLPLLAGSEKNKQRALLPVLLAAAAVLGTYGTVILLRATPWARFITFLIPLVLMWAAAGWLGFARWAQERLRLRWNVQAALAGIILAAALGGSALRAWTNPEAGFHPIGQAEQAALYLKNNLQAQELIVVGPPHDAPVWYYSRLHQVSMEHYKRSLPFFRAYILVDPTFGQTIDSVMDERMPDKFFFDMTTARLVYQAGSIQVFELIPDADLVRREYGLE